jgi:hypothetical protein
MSRMMIAISRIPKIAHMMIYSFNGFMDGSRFFINVSLLVQEFVRPSLCHHLPIKVSKFSLSTRTAQIPLSFHN